MGCECALRIEWSMGTLPPSQQHVDGIGTQAAIHIVDALNEGLGNLTCYIRCHHHHHTFKCYLVLRTPPPCAAGIPVMGLMDTPAVPPVIGL